MSNGLLPAQGSMSTQLTISSQLLAAAQAGDMEALGRLLQVYRGYLKLLAEPQLRGRLQSRFSASDVVQDVFLSAHRGFRAFRGGTEPAFRAWLRTILVHHLGRLVEQHVVAGKRNVRQEISVREIGAALGRSSMRLESVLAGCGDSPSDEASRHERAILLANQMEKLPSDYREVLVLRHLEGLPFAEVARQMGRSSGAVRMLWLRALESLRERMLREGVA
jgi:RNA polymerase sigma-70 factor (ECF subfamily)